MPAQPDLHGRSGLGPLVPGRGRARQRDAAAGAWRRGQRAHGYLRRQAGRRVVVGRRCRRRLCRRGRGQGQGRDEARQLWLRRGQEEVPVGPEGGGRQAVRPVFRVVGRALDVAVGVDLAGRRVAAGGGEANHRSVGGVYGAGGCLVLGLWGGLGGQGVRFGAERRVLRDPEWAQRFRYLGQILEVEGFEGGDELRDEGGDLGVRGGQEVWREEELGGARVRGQEDGVEDGAPDWNCGREGVGHSWGCC